MFQKLVNRNADLARLVERGYAISFDRSYLIVRDIPYLGAGKDLRNGAIVAQLIAVDDERMRIDDHQIYFAGSAPHGLDGKPISNLNDRQASVALSPAHGDVIVERRFSNKPRSGSFKDNFDKIESYVRIISGPATELHDRSPLTFNADETTVEDPIFKFHDTLTSRAGIAQLNAGLENEKIAIIGLGGTGSYLLDYAVKARIPTIIGFDGDDFHVHNAYRSPGPLNKQELGLSKAEVYQKRYESFRHGLSLKKLYIDSNSTSELNGVTFAFVCIDKGSARAEIFDLLIQLRIPFLDVGMGLKRKDDGPINGMMRTTYFPPELAAALKDKGLAELSDAPDNLYRENIQIGELNALNACIAMIRYKQVRSFYRADEDNLHMLFEIADLSMVAESNINDF